MKQKNFLEGVICDFGLARVSNASIAVHSHKFHEQIGLSPRYAAPEMFSKARAGIISGNPVSISFVFHFFNSLISFFFFSFLGWN